MRIVIAAATACSLFASMALAQDMPAQDGPSNPAIKSMHENNSAVPVAGANSFTKAQAKSAIVAKGYTHITKLKKDKDGVWHATAVKDGQSGPVSIDYQGNVN
jgi:putative membrane protein